MSNAFRYILLLLFLALALCSNNRVKLRDMEILILRKGMMTTGRRGQPIPHLKCIKGAALCPRPKLVKCYNRGFDGNDVQWECKAEMNSECTFGEIQVICEGHDYPEDPYILAGSCGLEYTLKHKPKEKNKSFNFDFDKKSLISFALLCALALILFWTFLRFLNPKTTSSSINQLVRTNRNQNSFPYRSLQPRKVRHTDQPCSSSQSCSTSSACSKNSNSCNRASSECQTSVNASSSKPCSTFKSSARSRTFRSRNVTSGFGGTRRR